MGMIAGSIRWFLFAFFPSLPVIFAASLLHGVVVAGVIIGGPYYIDAAVPERLRATAQGVVGMLGVSAGSIASNGISGWLFEHVSPEATYLTAAIGLSLLTLSMRWLLPHAERPPET
jgi:MFS family permease